MAAPARRLTKELVRLWRPRAIEDLADQPETEQGA